MPRPPRRPYVLLVPAATLVLVLAVGVWWPERDDLPTDGSATTTTSTAATELLPGVGRALALATSAAADDGHTLTLTSGFRTPAEQLRLLADAVAEHGPVEALRWVFPPERSMHVKGLAVDVGDGPAADWLAEHGAAFGLCRTLAWEWWHFEWRPAWERSRSCPAPVDDPADAPSADLDVDEHPSSTAG